MYFVEVGVVLWSVGIIVYIVIFCDVFNVFGLILCLFGLFGICFIVCVLCEMSGDVEEDNVGNSIFVIVVVVGMGNLLVEIIGVVLVFLFGGLGVEGGLGECEILWVSGCWVGEVDFGG